MTDPGPLHTMNPTARFSDRVDSYRKFRPSYPASAIDAIVGAVAGVCDSEGAIVAADIGAGTGISTRLLAGRGLTVYAIEPNAEMREAAAREQSLESGASKAGKPEASVQWIGATAEETTLPATSVDIVLCAQSFHWFRSQPALAEFRRILRRTGILALMWNDRLKGDPFTDGYTRLITEASADHPAVSRQDPTSLLAAGPHFRLARTLRFDFHQELDLDSLIGRALSASYVPKEGPAHDRLMAGLAALHREHAGPDEAAIARLRYSTNLYLGEPSGV